MIGDFSTLDDVKAVGIVFTFYRGGITTIAGPDVDQLVEISLVLIRLRTRPFRLSPEEFAHGSAEVSVTKIVS